MSMLRFQSKIPSEDLKQTEKLIRTKLDKPELEPTSRDSFIQFLLQSEYKTSVLRAALSGWERDIHRQYANILELKEIIRIANECIRCEQILNDENVNRNIENFQKKIAEKTQKLAVIQPACALSAENLNLAKESLLKFSRPLSSYQIAKP